MKDWIMELCPEIAEWQAELIAEECEKRIAAAREPVAGLKRCEFDDACDFCKNPQGGTWAKLTHNAEDCTETEFYICGCCVSKAIKQLKSAHPAPVAKQEPSGWLDEQTGDYSRVNRLGWSALYLHPAPVNQQLLEALRLAEAALSDIGDADREPGDDVAWCERRAAQAIPQARAAIAAAEGKI